MRAVQEIVECMLEGLPPDWERAQMVIELRKPMDLTGRVFYLMSTDDDGDDFVPFQPCDSGRPADLLIEARALLPRDRRGWTGAILLIQRDGRFGLNYDYP